MIRVGGYHHFKVCCFECGTPCGQSSLASDFFVFCCDNSDCLYRGANVVVERKTGMVISCDAFFTYVDGEWKRAFTPMYVLDGEAIVRVWPKESAPK